MANEEVSSDWGSNRERSIKFRLSQRQIPEGWPVGSFTNYANVQAVVDSFSDRDEFPVSDLITIGVDLMQVKRVVDRLVWSKVLGGGAPYGLWMSLFFGLTPGFLQEDWVSPLIAGLSMGATFGIALAAVPYAMQNGKQDFSTTTETVARRYDVLCNLHNVECTRDLLARRTSGGNRGQVVAFAVVKRCPPEAEPTAICCGAGPTPKTP